MATEKQIDWAVKLARWNKKDITRADVEALSNEQLDELFANLKNITVSKKPAVEKQPEIKKVQINYARFGLACKIVLTGVNFDFVFHNTKIYTRRILQYYSVMSEAEKALEATYIAGVIDADNLLDLQRDKELIAAGVM